MTIDRALLVAGSLWFGTMAGFFWSFSAVIMPGLGLASPTAALEAMQDINEAVRNPVFAIGFFGAALFAAALSVRALFARGWGRLLVLGAAGIYLVGVLGVTALGNVPMNEALALVDPGSAEAATTMAQYLRDWTNLNHVRTLAALTATAMLLLSFGHRRSSGD